MVHTLHTLHALAPHGMSLLPLASLAGLLLTSFIVLIERRRARLPQRRP